MRLHIVEFQDWNTPPPSDDDDDGDLHGGGGCDSDGGDSNSNGYWPGLAGGWWRRHAAAHDALRQAERSDARPRIGSRIPATSAWERHLGGPTPLPCRIDVSHQQLPP